ncbi:MAG: AAA family ATPase [Betaproteobacteria bacterium]|nr:AAA family ATPase [Betaproteobacteria bacterium]
MKASALSRLARLGVFGFDAAEPVILAALVTEDPLLLIGPSGTGKTYLLNTLSETLGLEHRHYNASLISFDDLVGFPYPDPDGTGVRFLQTPATVWGAQSVLIDEISRCKPEHQNRLFSLVHERRMQGIALPRLRWRWAAMNPCSSDQSSVQDYAGSEPLDPALADRFALFVNAADWADLDEEERRGVVDPGGEGRVAGDGGALRREVEGWRATFEQRLQACPALVTVYAIVATTALNTAGIRISPRRARLLARSLLAAGIVTGKLKERLFRTVLNCSLPHACWGEQPSSEAIAAAHRAAWDSADSAAEAWVHSFLTEARLDRKLSLLLDHAKTPDVGSQAIAQCLQVESKERAGAFAFALYPAAALGRLPIGAEGVNDLAKVAAPILSVEGEVSWSERWNEKNTSHPEIARIAKALAGLQGARAERAFHFFAWCMVEKLQPAKPAELERQIEGCVEVLRERGLA